jgi:hypothetical protein
MVAASLLGDAFSEKVDELSSMIQTGNGRRHLALLIHALAILFSLAWREPVQGSEEPSLTRKNPLKE